jgi:hypothetical protein
MVIYQTHGVILYIDMGHVLSIWDMVYRYRYLPYRYGHPGYRYGIWANYMGDDSINTVISHIDIGYLVTLPCPSLYASPRACSAEVHDDLISAIRPLLLVPKGTPNGSSDCCPHGLPAAT